MPKGVRLNDVGINHTDVSVSISIKAFVTPREVAVLPKIEGTPSPGHYLVGVVVTPQLVNITGPQDLLNGLDSIPTSPVFLNGIFGTVTESATLVAPPGSRSSTSKVTVTIEMGTIPSPPTPTPTPTPTVSPTP